MRETLNAAMPSVASVRRRSSTTNAHGGRDNTMNAVTGMQSLPCHVHPDTQRSIAEGELAGRLASMERFRIMLPYGTPIKLEDEITVDGAVYEVVQTDTRRSWALEVEVLAVRAS